MLIKLAIKGEKFDIPLSCQYLVVIFIGVEHCGEECQQLIKIPVSCLF